MKCERCGFENPDYLEFCQNCSAQLHKSEKDANRPSWGFVKAPTWTEPEFSADSVSEDDVPADFVSEMETVRRQQEAARRAAAAEAAERAKLAQQEADRIAEERRLAAAAAAAAKAEAEAKAAEEARAAEETARAAQRRAEEIRAAERRAEQERLMAERREAELAAQEAERAAAEAERRASRVRPVKAEAELPEDDSEIAVPAFLANIKKHREKAEKADKAPRRAEKPAREKYDDFDDDYPRRANKSNKSNKSNRSGGIGSAIRIAAVVAALALLAVAAWFLISGIKSCSDDKNSPTGSAKAPVIEVNPDKEGYYLVTVPAKEGKVLIYETADGRRSEVTVDGKNYVKFNVPASSLMTVDPVDGTMFEATPRVFIRNDDGSETLIDNMQSVMLSVPPIEIRFDQDDNIVSEDGKVTVSGHIDLIGTDLSIGGEKVAINPDGSFSHEIVYEDTGDYTIPVEGKLGGHQIYRHSFNVTVNKATPAESLIQLPWEYGDTEYTQRVKSSVDTIEVRGMVPAGSTLEPSCDSSNAALTVPTIADDGTFSFNAKLAYPGDYTIHLVCTSPSGQVSERDVHVQRAPDYNRYLSNAWQMNYASFAYENTQAYNIKGTVTEILQEGDYILAKMELTDGNVLVIEYHNHYRSAGAIEVGKAYEGIYGRPMGLNDEGVPQFYVWFVED